MLTFFVMSATICVGAEFNDVFEKALNRSPNLLAKQEKILASRQALKSQSAYKNPVISIGANDLPLNGNFLKRDLEPMQTQFVGITQEFETFGKLELKEAIARADTLVLEYELEDMKIELYKKTALLVEQISTSTMLIELLEQKKSNLEILGGYYENSISIEDGLKTSVELQKKIFALEDKILELQDKVTSLKNEFKYLTSEDFTSIQKAAISEEFFQEDIKKSPKYKIFEIKTKQLELQTTLEERKKYSNVNLNVSYNNRENFDDYLSFSASFALPIYGTEEIKVKEVSHLRAENVQKEDNYLRNATMIFQNNYKKAEYLNKRVENLDAILEKYKELTLYEKSNIKNSITLEKSIENENLLLDLKIEKLKYKLDIKTAHLELFYITKESL
ncbi:TolC family protein [Sulfurimonas sp.]|uniref:TolC family protein n=1 Tax=Sulfurimonas sp. TaxID=2022749 RepID=UPI00260CA48E|nr:TolC family protein [Sulfurimonas sp.]